MVKELMHDPIFLAGKSEVATKEDLQVAQDLLDTLMVHRESCVGMAANMIGVRKRIIAFDNNGMYMVMFNPEIIAFSGEQTFPGVEMQIGFGSLIAAVAHDHPLFPVKGERNSGISISGKHGQFPHVLEVCASAVNIGFPFQSGWTVIAFREDLPNDICLHIDIVSEEFIHELSVGTPRCGIAAGQNLFKGHGHYFIPALELRFPVFVQRRQ